MVHTQQKPSQSFREVGLENDKQQLINTKRMSKVKTFLEALADWNESQPDKTSFSFLNDSGDVVKSVSYAQLSAQSLSVATHLLNVAKLAPGDRVLLVYPPSIDFIIAFIGCLKAGIIAVPTFPPDPSKLDKDLTMFLSITESSGAKTALTSATYNYATKVAAMAGILTGAKTWPALTWIVTDTIFTAPSTGFPTPDVPSRDGIAFLQYTSGSTSNPKGVIITQRNLAHNLKIITTGLSAVEDTIVVSWLPQYHDMGLIGSYLGAVYCGGSGYYMSPFSYIRNPVLWVQCVSKYRGTHMQAPNFAYTLTARKFLNHTRGDSAIGGSSDLDLTCVRHMINAGDPLTP